MGALWGRGEADGVPAVRYEPLTSPKVRLFVALEGWETVASPGAPAPGMSLQPASHRIPTPNIPLTPTSLSLSLLVSVLLKPSVVKFITKGKVVPSSIFANIYFYILLLLTKKVESYSSSD